MVTAKLICVFVFAYAKSRFSHNEAHITSGIVIFSHFEAKIKKTDICVAKDFVGRFLVHDIVNSFNVNRFFL